MINIEGIQVDVVGSTDSLMTEWAVFTVEFEYDNKMIVCHTFDWSVRQGLIRLVKKILSPRVEGFDLRQALVNSQYLTVEVKGSFPKNQSALMVEKYDLINKNATYYPCGYNFLFLVNNSLEKPYAFLLHNKLIDNVSINAPKHIVKTASPRGRSSRPVFQYDKATGLFIRGFESVKEAALSTDMCATSINMCCNGHIKSAGGYLWSYKEMTVLSPPEDNRRKQTVKLTAEEKNMLIQEKQQKFIAENQK